MSKAIDVILGIGTAIVVYLFFILALSIVFEEPEYPNECYEDLAKPLSQNLTDEERNAQWQEQQEQREACEEPYQEEREQYELYVFLGAVIIGILLTLAVIPLRSMTNIAGGVVAAGVALIVYGFAIGWTQTGEFLKLIALFIAGAIIIGLAVWLQKKDVIKTKKKK